MASDNEEKDKIEQSIRSTKRMVEGNRRAIEKIKGNQKPFCNFCGKQEDEVRKLFAGSDAFICDECVADAWNLLEGKTL